MTKCTYCGRTDRACQTEAQVIGCDPMPAQRGQAYMANELVMDEHGRVSEMRNHVPEFLRHPRPWPPEPSPRQRLAETIQEAEKHPSPWAVIVTLEDARAILEALQEADRRAMQATIDGDMPCS